MPFRQLQRSLLPLDFLLRRSSQAGQMLPPLLRKKMESFFGADFSDVRIHVGAEASAIGARAFTVGADLYFAPGRYEPNTQRGQQLIGHELTHVLQQRHGRVMSPHASGITIVRDPTLEAEAEHMGAAAAEAMQSQRDSGPTRTRANNQLLGGHAPPALGRRAQLACVHEQPITLQCMQDLTEAEWEGQATTLAAELESGTGVTYDLGKFSSGGGRHAEDNLIAALAALPGAGGVPPGNYQLLVVINRSPCSAIAGSPPKAFGLDYCMERLIELQVNGVGGPPATHTFRLVINYRHLYGHSNRERALNSLGVRQGVSAGIQFLHGEGYYDLGVMKIVSELES